MAALTAGLAAATSATAEDSRVAFAVRAQPLEAALIDFALQADISIALPRERLEGLTTLGLHGEHTVEDGLAQLLAGSGLAYEKVGTDAYRVVAEPPPPVAAPAPAAPRASPEVEERETLVVIARRVDVLGDLPRSISHLGADRIVELGAHGMEDLAPEVGGMVLTNVGAGRNKVLLRGISDGALTGRAQSTVGLYFDDVRLTYAAPDPDLQLVDIASVDVLRGPQGALYGAGAIGGVVRIEPHPPDLFDRGGSVLLGVEATADGGLGHDLELVGNAPLRPGRVALRGVYYDQVVGGWLDNPRLGRENTNRTERKGGRLAARLQLTDAVTVDVSTFGQAIDSRDSQYETETPGGLVRQTALLEPHDNDFSATSVTFRAATRLGDVVSTTARVKHEHSSRYDATGAFDVLGLDPSATAAMDERHQLSILTQETRLSAPQGARIPWFLGVFFADGDNEQSLHLRDLGAASDDLAYTEDRVDGIDEAAVFGEVSWPLTDTLSLTTGLRLFSSQARTRAESSQTLMSLADSFAGDIRTEDMAPELRLSWRPAQRLLVYVSAAEGYRAAGFNTGGLIGRTISEQGQPFETFSGDELWTYEVGARFSTPSDRLAVSAVAFLNNWKDIQTDNLIADHFTYTGNAGDSRATGLELDVRYRPLDSLTLRGHALINEPELVRADPSFPAEPDAGLPGSPEYSGSASVRYARDLALGGEPATFYAEGAASYVGASSLDFGLGAEVGDYVAGDVRLGLSTERWDFAVSALNVTDSSGATVSDGNPYQGGAAPLITPTRPRMLSVSVRRSFWR